MSKNLVFYKEFTWNFCVFQFHKLKKKKSYAKSYDWSEYTYKGNRKLGKKPFREGKYFS